MVVERIEENIVIVELDDGKYIEVSKNKFPDDIREGDFVFESEDVYFINVDKTVNLRKKITELQNSLWN